MLPRSQSNPSGAENFGMGAKPKKKPAPPRPPQPAQNSQVFRSALHNYQRSMSINDPLSRPSQKSDLIDFSTPPSSPPKSALTNLNARVISNDANEFMYRVGASIFYLKSPLKNSTSGKSAATPFSPPRPSAESMLSTPVKTLNTNNKPNYQNTSSITTTHSTKNPAPTIIRQQHGGSVSSNSSTSTSNSTTVGGVSNNNNNNWNVNSQHQQVAQTRYSNVPLTWDSPPKKIVPPIIAPKPTIIRPAPITKTIQQPKRNYYDEPPVESEPEYDDSCDWDDDTIDSPPMPNEPPPPPPPDVEVEQVVASEWPEETLETNYYPEPPSEPNGGAESDQPYAIALYDYVPEAEGDLALQAGDLVYLTKVIDESWLYGMCGGLEGMFPTNYVNVVVPLPEEFGQGDQVLSSVPPVEINSVENSENQDLGTVGKYYYADVLYQFKAETENDLNLEPGDIVTIWGRINDDWLYGTLKRERGQFPATFVSPVPDNLPIINL